MFPILSSSEAENAMSIDRKAVIIEDIQVNVCSFFTKLHQESNQNFQHFQVELVKTNDQHIISVYKNIRLECLFPKDIKAILGILNSFIRR